MATQGVKVLVRIRPAKSPTSDLCTSFTPSTVTIPKPFHDDGSKTYSFDSVLGPESCQDDVFEEVQVLLKEVFQGRNSTIFAYGQTGSGKTFTMDAHTLSGSTSNPSVLLDRQNPGITARSVDFVFDHIERNALDAVVHASFVEVYNDQAFDLLVQNSNSCELKKLEVRTVDRKVSIRGLTSERHCVKAKNNSRNKAQRPFIPITSDDPAYAPLRMQIETTTVDANGEKTFRSKLCLIDLAGSEDNRYTGNEGQRMKESRFINSSLFAIRSVVLALKENKKEVPYRNSTVTKLLVDCLGGSACALAVICCAPESENLQPTHSTLEFARDCCFIQNNIEINEVKRRPPAAAIAAEEHAKALELYLLKRELEKKEKMEARRSGLKEDDVKAIVKSMMDERDEEEKAKKRKRAEDRLQNALRVLNKANRSTLEELKFIGPSRSEKILNARSSGPFTKPSDLTSAGLSRKELNTIFLASRQCESGLRCFDIAFNIPILVPSRRERQRSCRWGFGTKRVLEETSARKKDLHRSGIVKGLVAIGAAGVFGTAGGSSAPKYRLGGDSNTTAPSLPTTPTGDSTTTIVCTAFGPNSGGQGGTTTGTSTALLPTGCGTLISILTLPAANP
ncbi:P-loop containing nucleoside triphosphate hydrolase protein [Blyttiomyces helicus]|uniref:Kinesin-like protein n=1 Tax=Blyttiomyces helicus TaxID=388810 RepID=A0A4P9W446_9FUNG|nr:P-loop containing nucleoside triphosphate hydrolase protein [Blyttiomyces helicus]|eukprot:RKO86043.1 P-loop containing nucleoside triphosphate hydrolase protein [Blyttiomyces helicus]